jgi:glycosyltransferase involved in cell wall biosynthesis
VGNELLDSLGDGVRFHGRVPDGQVYDITRRASFAILLRDDAKWSRACFPSRVTECSALGVPMLCNLTSDLADYLRDGDNAIVVPEVSVAGFRQAVQRALALSEGQWRNMKQAARALAERFDGSAYAPMYRRILA